MENRGKRLRLLPILLSLALLVMPYAGVAALTPPRTVGGYEPIPDPNAREVQELAKFAVAKSGQSLVLTRVLGGQQQLVAGRNYRLILGARRSSFRGGNGQPPRGLLGPENIYAAVVFVGLSSAAPQLLSFKQIF